MSKKYKDHVRIKMVFLKNGQLAALHPWRGKATESKITEQYSLATQSPLFQGKIQV